MTETTEEKDLASLKAQNEELSNLNIELEKQLSETMVNLSDTLWEFDNLEEESTRLQAQVSSLTKERDELKDQNHDLGDEICRLEDVNGDLKVQVCCLDVENKEFKSQLSNRDKEIEELKQNIRNFINEGEGFCPDCLDRALKDLPFVSLEYREDKILIKELEAQLSNREKENHELSSWEYGEFMKPNSETCKAQSSVFDALKLTHSMLPSLLLSQRNGGLAIEDWRALSNAGHTIKSNAQKVVTALEEGEEE